MSGIVYRWERGYIFALGPYFAQGQYRRAPALGPFAGDTKEAVLIPPMFQVRGVLA